METTVTFRNETLTNSPKLLLYPSDSNIIYWPIIQYGRHFCSVSCLFLLVLEILIEFKSFKRRHHVFYSMNNRICIVRLCFQFVKFSPTTLNTCNNTLW